MRKLLILISLVVWLPSFAQPAVTGDEELLKELIVDSFQDLFSDLKAEKLHEYYTEDFLLLENGQVWDMDVITRYLEQAQGQDQIPKRINTFDWIKIEIMGDQAWLAYHNHAEFRVDDEMKGEMNWLESATAIRTPNGWKLQMLHSTVVKRE